MLNSHIPYVQSPARNACALASFTMVAKAFFPDTTLDEIKKITRWRDGKVVWAAPFWFWLAQRGIRIVSFDSVPLQPWAEEGFESLQNHLSSNTFAFYKNNTYDPDQYQNDLRQLFLTPQFTYNLKQPFLDDLRKALKDGAICEALVDSCALNGVEGFSLHRVVILDVSDDQVIMHDPVRPESEPKAFRQVPLEQFLKAWPSEKGGSDSCELCSYYKDTT